MENFFNISIVIAYFALVLWIGIRAGKKRKSKESYLIANRQVGVLALTATSVASVFGANAFFGFIVFIFEYQALTLWTMLGLCVGLTIAWYFLAPKLKKLSDEYKFYTFTDYFNKLIGPKTGFLVTVFVALTYIGGILVQYIAGGHILAGVTGWSYNFSVFLMGTIVIIYLYMAGYQAVIKTDIIQFFVILLLIIISSVIIFNGNGGSNKINFDLVESFDSKPWLAFALFNYGVIGTLMSPDGWRRIYSGRSVKAIKKAIVWSGVVFVALEVLVFILGMTVRAKFPEIQPEMALPFAFKEFLPGYLVGLSLIVFFAAVMSSLDTQIFTLSSSFSQDILAKLKGFEKSSLVKETQMISIFTGLIGMLLAFFFSDLMDAVLAYASVFLCLAPITILSFFFKIKEWAAVWSLIASLLTVMIVFFNFGIDIAQIFVSIPIGLLVLGLGQWSLKDKKVKTT